MRVILGAEAQSLDLDAKWKLLSPFICQYGRDALSYATLQQGMEYFIHERGYIAFVMASHPVFARQPKPIVLVDPVCDRRHLDEVIRAFLRIYPNAVFSIISEHCAGVLRSIGFKANCVGYEPELPVQQYNTKGDWKEYDLIKRARNEARREGLTIREVDIATVPVDQLQALSAQWMKGKKVNDREIWIFARRPVYHTEPGVRKFVAFDRDGKAVGYVFYDPMYRDGKAYGYSANTVRCDENRYGRLATAIHMVAMETFREEGVEVLNLCLCPFTNLEKGVYSDDLATRWFFQISERFGGEIYNFKGLSFHKSKYRGQEKLIYYASNSLMPSNDVYLAFQAAEIATNYFTTMGLLGLGLVKAMFNDRG
jgi:lysylphosphatidylglycerol synthetase-like protein (DUF2156 family)